MSWLAAAAALLLVIAASFPAPARPRVGAGLLVALCCILGVAAALPWALRGSRWVSSSPTSRVVKYGLRELGGVHEANVLVMDGGSYAHAGVDASMLEQELRERGYHVRVVKLALPGANHFERQQMYADLASRLAPKPPQQRWVFLQEVHEEYDHLPLAQFAKNQGTVRVYHYMTPQNAWSSLLAASSVGGEGAVDFDTQLSVARHALVNGFNVGLSGRLKSLDQVKPADDDAPARWNRFRFRDLSELEREGRRPLKAIQPPSWLKGRDRRLRTTWQGHIDEWVSFGVPSTQMSQLLYIRGYCKVSDQRCIEPDATVLKALNERKMWLNSGHLALSGARVYTRWLAIRLDKAKVLRK